MDEKIEAVKTKLKFSKGEIKKSLSTFSSLERLVFILCVIVGVVALVSILGRINQYFLVPVPSTGGTLKEGVVGTPRFVNPLLAVTDTDRDLTRLVYRGLMKEDSEGNIVPDIAESYTVSSDGLVYTFTLRETLFEDGKTITAEDVAFTVKSAQDSTLKSTRRVEWAGVMTKVIDEKNISFTLKQVYSPFIESTTLGIIPKHVWEKIPYESWNYSDLNTKNAVGSGPYRISSISEDSSGIPDYYELKALELKNGDSPLIETIDMFFFASEDELIDAYKTRKVDAISGISPQSAKALVEQGAHILALPLPRVFGLFFNQNSAKIFTDSNVRKAIRLAINKNQIVNDVLLGYGEPTNSPIPSATITSKESTNNSEANLAEVKKILEKASWKLGEDGIYQKQISKKETSRLSFEIATNDVPELKQAVSIIIENLRGAGIEAVAKVYETGSLNQDIIRTRKFQSLFFGEVVSNQSDLFAFWHSSQRNDPGLNISGYANPKTDKTLETALHTLDTSKLAGLYSAFEKEILADTPAVFVYSPTFIYALRPELIGITVGRVKSPEDRFNLINESYLSTDKVWKIFAK
ncbi:MAG: peptide ABC transporter substrate-binding protein [Candidatus Pacebacteria bacterium]|nr:peptide ABC transporter substrate-binding protein [Candidatus Paceibacterota bacterium]